MKRKIYTLLIGASVMGSMLLTSCAPVGAFIDSEPTAPTYKEWSFEPGEDFYGYVNVDYLKTLTFNPEVGGAGSFETASTKVDDEIKELIREIANGNPDKYEKGSNEELIYKYYWQVREASSKGEGFMNESEVGFIREWNEKVQNASDMDELMSIMGKVDRDFGTSIIGAYFIETGLQDSDSYAIYYGGFKAFGIDMYKIGEGKYLTKNAKDLVKKALMENGVSEAEAETRATNLAYMLIDIGKKSREINDDYDPYQAMLDSEKLSSDEVNKIMPNAGYKGFIQAMGVEKNVKPDMYLEDKNQLIALDSKLTDENLQMWKDFIITNIYNSTKELLPASMGGSSQMWTNDKMAIEFVNTDLMNLVGEVYSEKYSDQEVIDDVTKMIEDIIGQYRVLINNSDYSAEAKAIMLKKLDTMSINVGASKPHETDPDDSNLIGNTVFETRLNLCRNGFDEEINKLGTKPEKNGFETMAPQIVNACYKPNYNSINIPLAIINDPFYSKSNTYSQNLGGIGVVIGHEISHAFDDTGIKFDEHGNYLPDRFPQADKERFSELQNKTVAYYSSYKVLEYLNVDGEKTLGENLADIASLQCCLSMVQSKEDKKNVMERFAICFAGLTLNTDAIMLLKFDVHSPDKVRINAAVSSMNDFYEVYGVKETDSMYVKPENRINRW